MSDKSAIEWTDATWNPVAGCSIVSPGCMNCYAMRMAARLEAMGSPIYAGMTKKVNGNIVWTGKIEQSNWGQVIKPLSWKRPRMVFVNSMSDLFHEAIPDSVIDTVFAVMALCPQHTFQVLTKRVARMCAYLSNIETKRRIFLEADLIALDLRLSGPFEFADTKDGIVRMPLPNVWLGVSAERQQEADERIPLLLQTPAAVRFISAEPLLGPINLTNLHPSDAHINRSANGISAIWKDNSIGRAWLNWVIVGGESGPNARPFHVEWADEIIDQCREAQVPCFVKQLGSSPVSDGYPLELWDRKGGDDSEWPDRLKIRQFPKSAAPRSPVVTQPSNAEAVVEK